MRTTQRTCLMMATALVLAACGGESKVNVQMGGNSGPVQLGEGDVQVKSTDGALVLSVVGDSVVMQLSDSLRNSVTAEVKSSTAKQGDDIGSTIANAVGGAVSGVVNAAMGMSVRVPAENIENLRYEDGNLRFDVKGSSMHMSSKSGGSSGKNENGGAFSEEDAMRFITAVNDAQARRTHK